MIALKSPRTPHLVGSGIPTSGENKDRVDWTNLIGRFVVLEEKLDGTEVSFHFDGEANLIGRERSNAIDLDRRGGQEKHLDRFKDFLQEHADALFERIEDRFVVYAEWCAVVHTIFYNALPSYLIECDIQCKSTGEFLSAAKRRELLAGLPIKQAPVLFEGPASSASNPSRLVTKSAYIDEHLYADWHRVASEAGLDPNLSSIDTTGRAEGIYGKVEDADHVIGRFKWVREDFIRMIVGEGNHWKNRTAIRNLIKPD